MLTTVYVFSAVALTVFLFRGMLGAIVNEAGKLEAEVLKVLRDKEMSCLEIYKDLFVKNKIGFNIVLLSICLSYLQVDGFVSARKSDRHERYKPLVYRRTDLRYFD